MSADVPQQQIMKLHVSMCVNCQNTNVMEFTTSVCQMVYIVVMVPPVNVNLAGMVIVMRRDAGIRVEVMETVKQEKAVIQLVTPISN